MNQYYYATNYDQTLNAMVSLIKMYWLVCLAITIFMVMVKWKILVKAGKGGWEQFIPFYSIYVEYDLYWDSMYFWLSLVSPLIVTFLLMTLDSIFVVLGLLLAIVTIVLPSILQIKKAKAFGCSFWFGIGLLIINPIFLIILAFDRKCEYIRR